MATIQETLAKAQKKKRTPEQIAAAAQAAGIPNPMASNPVWTQVQSPGTMVAPWAKVAGTSGWPMGDIAMAGRPAPTVATPSNPVQNFTVSTLAYDPNNPWDFIKKINARKAIWGKLNESDIYNYQVALEAQQKAQTDMTQNPFADQLASQNALIEETKASQMSAREKQIAQKQQELDAKYWALTTAAQQAGEREKGAAQRSTSFSWFGRSTFNAEQQVQIEQSTNQALQQLEAAKQMELQAYQAELEGADAETLSSMYDQITKTQEAANKRQLEAIAKTAEINAGMGTSMQEAINNLLSSASQAGMAIWPDDAKNLEIIATSVAGMSPEQRETYLSQFDDTTRALIEWAAAASGGQWEAQETVTVGSGKNARVFQRNPATWMYDIPVWASWVWWGGWGIGWMWWAGSAAAAWWNSFASSLDNLSKTSRAERLASLSKVSSWIAWALSPEAASLKADYDYIKNNLTVGNFLDIKKKWGTFGAMSEAERDIVRSSASKLNPWLSDAEWNKELNRIADVMWVAAQRAAGQQPTVPTIPTATASSFDDLWNSL